SRWLHRYDPPTDTWTQLDNMPGRREYCRAGTVDDHIYLIGGADQTGGYHPRGDAFRYDLGTASWDTSWTSLSVPRSHTSVGRLGNKLVVAGGNENVGWSWNQYTIRGTTEVLDLDNPGLGWQTKTPILGDKRGWSATAVVQDKLYMLGGATFDSSGAIRLQEALCYTADNDTWTALTAPPLGHLRLGRRGLSGSLYHRYRRCNRD
ncbi:MAG: hypothetical protein K8R46_00995, partial [Pirellulales bacterium]|nr:hypothetical protein [Pirellulales bacterium]